MWGSTTSRYSHKHYAILQNIETIALHQITFQYKNRTYQLQYHVQKINIYGSLCLLLNGTSALFRPVVPRIVEVEHMRHVKNDW